MFPPGILPSAGGISGGRVVEVGRGRWATGVVAETLVVVVVLVVDVVVVETVVGRVVVRVVVVSINTITDEDDSVLGGKKE